MGDTDKTMRKIDPADLGARSLLKTDSTTVPPFEPAAFRKVLSHYPTGVSVVTTVLDDGSLAGMVVGSFTSVSLAPPLVGFLPAKNSLRWAKMATSTHFCVNVLDHQQEWLCRRFVSKTDNMFEGVSHVLSPSGLPILDGAVVWFDCARDTILEAGDHWIVLGAVEALGINEDGGNPLVFLKGGYGRYETFSS